MITLNRYVLVQQLTQGLAGMAPEWPEADPALNRFVLATDAAREIERLEAALGHLRAACEEKESVSLAVFAVPPLPEKEEPK